MYPVSANFHTLAIQDAPKTRVRIYFIGDAVDCTDDNSVQTNGTLLIGKAGDTDSNGRIGQNGITFSEFFNPDKNIQVGAAVSSQIGMTLLNTDGALDNFQYGRCKVYLDVYDAANSSWLTCPMGVYIIDLPTKRKVQLVNATGYDQMQKLDEICDTWWSALNWSGGITLSQLLTSLATQIGVSVSSNTASAIVNGAVSFTEEPFQCIEVTYREVLEYIAEATGTVARFDRNGALDLRWFAAAQISGNTVTVNTDTVGNQCLAISVAEYSVAAVDLLKVKLYTDDIGTTVGTGTNQYTIVNNLFLDGANSSAIIAKATPIYNRLHGLGAYSPVSARIIMDWSIEAGDIINIVHDSTTYSVPIFQQSMAWRGGYVVSDLLSDGDNVRPVLDYDERTYYRLNSEMSKKVGDNEIISKINQSPESITIQANKVNLTGYVTFTNLSTDGQTSISGGNITTGTISADRIAAGSLSISKLDSATQNTITTAASDASTALSNAATAQSTAESANSQEQLIYISRVSGTTTQSATTTWITDTTGNQNTWTIKRPTYNSSYPVLFVATQRKNVAGTVTCTTPQIDNTTTVIDGGHITTGTIDASVVNVSNINADNIKTGTLKAITIQDTGTTPNNYWDLSGGNFVATNGSIGGFTLSSSGLSYGDIRPEGSGTGFALRNNAIYSVRQSGSDRYVASISGAGLDFGDNTNATPGVWRWRTGLNHGNVNVDGTFRDSFYIDRLNPPDYTTSSSIVDFTDNGTNFYTIFNGDVKATGDLTVGGDVEATGDLTVGSDLTVDGVLDVTPRRCYAASLDAGWHRVLVFTSTDAGYRRGATGNEIVFHITRRRTNAGEETHEIKMLCQYDNVSFVGEISKSISNYQRITKIRYNYDGSNGYVDIYVAATSAHVTADFEVYCEPAYQALYTAASLQSVVPSPSGETVMTEYSFAENIPESGSGYTKQPDGTLIQWGIVSGLSFAAQNIISGTENLPVSFANTSYIVQASAITTGVNQYLFRCGAYPNTTAKFDWVLGSGDSSNITISNRAFTWTAIGRWK